MKKNKAIALLTTFIILLVLGIVFAFVSLDKGQLGHVDYKSYPKQIKLGLDLKGGVYAVYRVEATEKMTEEEFKNKLKSTIISFQDILFSKGYSEAVVTETNVTSNSAEIRVEVPDINDPQEIFRLIGKPATVTFATDKENKNVVISGTMVKNADVTVDKDGKYQISLTFDAEGTKAFGEITAKLAPKKEPLYIFVDGKELMAPKVNEAIYGGQAVITGNYTYDEAKELALRIQSGSLPLKLELVESDTLSPTLGQNALKNGLIAGAVALVLIFLLLIAMYRKLGIAASIALIYFTMTYLFFLAVFPWVQLTLAGIAGILLSIGMAVDANIIIFERVKEEYRISGGLKSIKTCVNNGFKRSASAIIDGNVTTIMGAIILLIFGVASIKGFAITLLIGIFLSLFTSLLVTRFLINIFLVFDDKNINAYSLHERKKKYLVTNKDGSNLEKQDEINVNVIENNNNKNKQEDDREYDEEFGMSDEEYNEDEKFSVTRSENKSESYNERIIENIIHNKKPKKQTKKENYKSNYKKLTRQKNSSVVVETEEEQNDKE